MERIVKILTCDRCGKEVRIPKFKDFDKAPECWERVQAPWLDVEAGFDLCPECSAELNTMFNMFMEKLVGAATRPVTDVPEEPSEDRVRTEEDGVYCGDCKYDYRDGEDEPCCYCSHIELGNELMFEKKEED